MSRKLRAAVALAAALFSGSVSAGVFTGNMPDKSDNPAKIGVPDIPVDPPLMRLTPLPPYSEMLQHEWKCEVVPDDGKLKGPSGSDVLPRGADEFINYKVNGDTITFIISDSDGIRWYGVDYDISPGLEKSDYTGEGIFFLQDSVTLNPAFDGMHPVSIFYQDTLMNMAKKEIAVIAGSGEDSELQLFLDWMRQQGYSEALQDLYSMHFRHPLVRKQAQNEFALRSLAGDVMIDRYKSGSPFPMVIHDLVPTDENSTFSGTTQDELGYLESMAERIFGRDFAIEHRTDYKAYSDFDPVDDGGWVRISIPKLRNYIQGIANAEPDKGHVFHIALTTMNMGGEDKPLYPYTGSGPAYSTDEVQNDPEFTGGNWLHEFGHDMGLTHRFLPTLSAWTYSFYGADDIMVHGYIPYGNSETGRLGDPLTLYVLEHGSGYSPDVIETYNNAMKDSWMLTRTDSSRYNYPPTEPRVAVSVDEERHCLTCSAFGSFDRNGDDLSCTYSWFVDGVPLPYIGPGLCLP